MANVGYATLQIIPSVRGIGDELRRQLIAPAGNAGDRAGDAAGDAFTDAFEGALDSINMAPAAERAGEEMGDQAGETAGRRMLSTLGTALKVGGVAVAAGAGLLFAEAFGQAVEQSKANKKLAAQLGLTAGESERAGKLAGSLFAQGYGESIDQVNEGLRTLSQAGIISVNGPRKEVEGLTKSALSLAEAFDVEVGAAATAAGQLVRTGLVKNAREAFDLITAGFQQGADKSGDFLDTLNEYPTQFRDLGLTGAQAVGLLTQGLRAGARDSDIVADAFKEFAIRAKDGSDTTAEGFEAIGLSADTMAQTFTTGGPKAAAALDVVLDRLRAIPDPVKRSQTAVLLFGTQAEDLQQALFALDPSKAVGALGAVGGAADRMGKTLHGNAGASFEVFKRQILQGLSDFITRNVLPAVMAFGTFLNTYVLPAARTVGGALAAVLVPAVTTVGSAFMAGVQWVREYGAWLLPVGVAVAGLTITMNASAIATAAVTAVFSVYRGVLLAAAAVTRGYAIVQGLLNAVMSANPIGLIITGIAALVTLLAVAWNKSDTFRAVVMAAWAGIQSAWSSLWTGYLQPGFAALMTGLRAIGDAASWLWTTILSPVFSAIGLAARVLVAILAVVLIMPVVALFQMLGAIASWLWSTVLKPVFAAIGFGAQVLWQAWLKPAFDATLGVFRAVGSFAMWLWTNAIRPSFQQIGAIASWLWANAIRPAMSAVMTGLRAVGAGASWLWTNAVQPAFKAIGDLASWLWNRALRPALDAGGKAVELFGVGFGAARDAISKAWNQVMDIAKKPVNFIIEWVYTKGIKATWDKVAGFVGLGPLPAAPKLLASGGTVGPGWGPAAPMKVNRPTAIVGEGNPRHPEYVIPTDPKYRGRALALWESAGTQLMADGGIIGGAIDWLGGAAKKIGGAVMSGVDFLSDPAAMWEKATAFIRDKVKQIGQSGMAQMLAKIPGKMLGGLKDKIVNAITGMFGDGGGKGGSWARPVSAALGTRYGVRGRMWSSGYHTGTDFPAATGTAVRAAANGIVQSALSGGPYGNHITLTHGGGLSSLYAHLSSMSVRAGQRVLKGMRIGAVGSTGNTTGPHLHFEARRNGRTINPEPLLGYDSGGWLRPGFTSAVNRTGQPEAVLTSRQWAVAQAAIGRAVAAAAPQGAPQYAAPPAPSAAAGGLAAGARVRLVVGEREFEAYVEEIADAVVEDTMRPVAAAIAGMRG
ncbi:peptidoglycan DD-metalloendopeptidase family protein [Streptomyces thermolilacinus]